ncbi:hypothetical protein [Thorsellia anophelis]|uniref:Filamentous hemagglutinin n=1 Tax=Thorsellia anophelis DSM 18579 TaxID=1123402 RepID=A0A1I0D4M6_9GAMM|nr:hypothetical protein [Thorsellia anophelis]SET27093.1 filamentous hemagglutinin [Thorsellia anophelis DSM 18579]
MQENLDLFNDKNWKQPLQVWHSDAGNALMYVGFDNFQNLYNGIYSNAMEWDINQLRSEQTMLQYIHMTHLREQPLFNWAGELLTGALNDGNSVNLMDYKSRFNFGCYKMGYSESDGFRP